MATLNSITRLLKPSKTILFCGAGVSYNSGIPLANQIKYSILCNLDLTEDENKIIISSKLPFELFMQIILFKDDSSIFQIFINNNLNSNHFYISKLISKGRLNTVITTNFDKLIETAILNEIGYSSFKISNGVYSFYKNNRLVNIYKIHGSIENINKLIVTLTKVANKLNVNKIKHLLNNLLNNKKYKYILFLGYSFSDYFDIIPALAANKTTHLIPIIINHIDKGKTKITNIKSNSLFSQYKKGFEINTNTNRFIKYHSKILNIPYVNKLYEEGNYKDVIDKYLSNYTASDKTLIKARLLFEISEFELSLKYYKILNVKNYPNVQKANIYIKIGTIYRILANYKAAIIYHRKALKPALLANDAELILSVYNCISVAFEESGKIIEAKKQLDVCLDDSVLKKIFMNDEVVTNNYARYLYTLGKFDLGFKYSRLALRIAQKKGEKRYESRIISSIAIGYYYLSKFKNAIYYFKKSKDISELIGDKEGVHLQINNLAACYVNLKDYKNAANMYDILINEIGIKQMSSVTLSNYAHVLYHTGNKKSGYYFIKKATDKALKYGEMSWVAGCYLIHANFLFGVRNKMSYKFYKKSEQLYIKLGNNTKLNIVYERLGDLLLRDNQANNALIYYNRALKLSKLIYNIKSKYIYQLVKKIKAAT